MSSDGEGGYRGAMTKTQKLRNLAEGLMAGLVECGYRGPWRWAHHQWEGPFYRAWDRWEPHTRPEFPPLELGGSSSGRSSQARVVLWQLKSTSPFHAYESQPLTDQPRGMEPREYLEECCDGATADEWVELAKAFLAEMDALGQRVQTR
ncbi:hypothetical protein ABKW28_14645 [Nocardioides sp. 31GB23]|uniref:hypothetical protein n=1 Tax=Nocardioides sp. 31GB23 TaxID=3156065 RepID=UPI0032AFC85E